MHVLFRSLIGKIIKTGDLTIEYADGEQQTFGNREGPPLKLRFADKRGPTDLIRNPELAFGELFMDGRMVVSGGSIYDVLSLISRNAIRGAPPAWLKALRSVRDATKVLRLRNNRKKARANVAHHYDLDDRLYRLFLDSDRQYSCAYFETPDATLEDAQQAKKRHIAAKLLVEPGHTVLDIGCGWGGLALYLARFCGAEVTGITLSTEQFANATRRAAEANLDAHVRFRIEDYRDIEGTFDRVVSVGMFEHVGPLFYDAYFAKVASLLKPNGTALIHTIGRPDGPGATNPWVVKYIFPGGHTPSLSEIAPAIERAGLYITDVEVLRMHYAETLAAWRRNFLAHRDEALALYDERFCRMWEFYLAGAECAFRFEGECIFQLQVSRRHDAVPLTRDYITDAERRLRGLESRDSSWMMASQ